MFCSVFNGGMLSCGPDIRSRTHCTGAFGMLLGLYLCPPWSLKRNRSCVLCFPPGLSRPMATLVAHKAARLCRGYLSQVSLGDRSYDRV